MVRGGGAGGGGAFAGQLLDLLGGIASMPADDLLRIGLGLLLMVIIIVLLRRSTPAPPPMRAATICLLCGRRLQEPYFVDRHVPSWAACTDCYADLPEPKRRQYRAHPASAVR